MKEDFNMQWWSVRRFGLYLGAAVLVMLGAACSESNVGGVTDVKTDVATTDIQFDAAGEDSSKEDILPVDSAEADTSEEDTFDAGVEDTSKPEWGDCVDGGEPGCPCDVPDDCNSGYCITTGDGKQCTSTCDSECPQGWRCADVSTNPMAQVDAP